MEAVGKEWITLSGCVSVCGGRVRHQPSVNTIRLSPMSRSALNPNQEGLAGVCGGGQQETV